MRLRTQFGGRQSGVRFRVMSVRSGLGVLGVVCLLFASAAQAEEPSLEQFLLESSLDPVRRPERAEMFLVEVAPLADPAEGAPVPELASRLSFAADPVPVPADTTRDLSRVLLTRASYGAKEARCNFQPVLAIRFHQGPSAVDALVSLHCIELAFQRVGTPSISPTWVYGPAAWELLELFRRTRPGDSRLYYMQRDWGARGDQARQSPAAKRRWTDAMPAPVRPFWEEPSALLLTYEPEGKGGVKFVDAKVDPQQAALAQQIPEPTMQIRLLLHWYGSGAGPWSGYPSYEGTAALLLMAHTTQDLLAAAQASPLTAEQKEGAARLFASWEFTRERPKDGKLLPAALRAELLEHSLLSSDEDKRKRAEAAFAAPAPEPEPKKVERKKPARKK